VSNHKRYNSEKYLWENTSIESLENQVIHKPFMSSLGRNFNLNSDKNPVKSKKKR